MNRLFQAFSRLLPASARIPRTPFCALRGVGGPNGAGVYSSLARRSNLMAQFERIKKQYQNYILLFQVGDFYEMYGEDASEFELTQ